MMETMKAAFFHMRRSNPWIRGVFVLYLLSTLLLAAGHQHPAGVQGHDCSLCTAAHTPATVAAAIDCQTAPATAGYLLLAPGDQRCESEAHGTTRSRAPPLV